MRIAIILVKGHESKQYYALRIIVGLFYNFTIVKMKGPNKNIKNERSNKVETQDAKNPIRDFHPMLQVYGIFFHNRNEREKRKEVKEKEM